jgi:hypothetical protein
MKEQPKQKWKPPVILYEEPEYPGAPANPIPYIETSKDDLMPPLIMIEEVFDTGEVEPGPSGRPEKICDNKLHQYLDMQFVQSRLSKQEFDDLRQKLGMMPKDQSAKLGDKILKKVDAKIDVLAAEAQGTQKDRMAAAKEHYENKKKDLN